MLQISTDKPTAVRARGKTTAAKAREIDPPTVIVAAATEPHPIYGTLKMEKDTLQRQPMFMLNTWHEKAIRFADEFFRTHSPEEADASAYYNELYNAAWDILQAALGLELKIGRDVAFLLQILARHAEDRENVEWLDIGQLKSVATGSLHATRPAQPTKRPGPFTRGRKLTRAGLLFRYQSFLAQELMTVSWELYGDPNVALSCIPFDHEVTKRCSADFKDGEFHPRRPSRRRHDPFLDQHKLSTRARSVLRSLKIDTQTKS